MKRTTLFAQLKARLSGFTLIELLTVIAIIAILAGVLLPTISSALKAAKRAKAANTATGIQTAVTGYYTEYSVYPLTPAAATAAKDYLISDTSSGLSDWTSTLFCLCGNINPSNGKTTPAPGTLVPNTRNITFLSIKSSDLYFPSDYSVYAPLNPLPPNSTNVYFNLAIDGDYDGVIGTSPSNVTTMPNFNTSTLGNITIGGTSTAGVAVWANCNTSTTINPNYYVHTY